MIEQLQTFIFLTLPATFPGVASSAAKLGLVPPRSPLEGMHADETEVPLTAHEIHALETHERGGRSVEGFERLLRLAKYFRGRTSVQEILWREDEELWRIESLCSEFRLLLTVCKRPG